MKLVLGIPCTNSVARVQPRGKPVGGREVNEFAEKLVEIRFVVHPFSMFRSCTIGRSTGEPTKSFPHNVCDRPRKPEPPSTNGLPRVRGEVAVAMVGCDWAFKPRAESYK